MKTLPRRLVLTLAVLIALLYDWAAVQLGEKVEHFGGELIGPALVGLVVVQLCLLAAFLAWAARHRLSRWLTYWFLAVLGWYATVAGAAATGNSFSVGSVETLLAICTLPLAVLIPFPYWLVRTIARRRIRPPADGVSAARRARQQFTARTLLTWTAAAAVLAAIAQSRIGREVWENWPMRTSDFIGILPGMALLSAAASAVALPVTWIGLTAQRLPVPLSITVAWAIAATGVEWAVVLVTSGDHYLWSFAGLNLGLWLGTAGGALLLRVCGYRLVRSEK